MNEKNVNDSYSNRRSEEIINAIDVAKLVGVMKDYYNLGQAVAFGCCLYLLKQDNMSIKMLENYIVDMLNDNSQIRNDAFCIMGELCSNSKKK